MIIRETERGLLFITQPDHAHLSRRIMEHCVALGGHPRAASILLAIGEHDNGWTEVDAAPLVDPGTGQPLDFVNAPAEVRQQVWPRGIGRLAHDSWAAALVAKHAITVYDRYHGDPQWTAFFARMRELRDDMLSATGGRADDLADDYRFVRLGDLLSLVFCTGWTEEQRFAEWTVSSSDEQVVVTPDPFGGAAIPVEIGARRLPVRASWTEDDVRQSFAEAELTVLRGVVAGGNVAGAGVRDSPLYFR